MDHLFESDDIQRLVDCADLLELLSISLTNPTRGLAAALNDGSYLSDLSACLDGISDQLDKQAYEAVRSQSAAASQAFAAQDAEALYHQINQEFTRLFVSPKREQMPLYESLIVHPDDEKTSMFINPTCMHAEQVYRKSGFPFPEKGKTPGDHVSIELRYLAYLLSRRIGALTAQNEAEEQAAERLIREFAGAHIKRWLHPFMDELFRIGEHPFYHLVAQTGLALESVLTGD